MVIGDVFVNTQLLCEFVRVWATGIANSTGAWNPVGSIRCDPGFEILQFSTFNVRNKLSVERPLYALRVDIALGCRRVIHPLEGEDLLGANSLSILIASNEWGL